MSSPGNAVVLGGTGFVGRHIGAVLDARGFDVTLVARRKPDGPVPGRFAALDIAAPSAPDLAGELAAFRPELVVNAVGSIWGRNDARMWPEVAVPTLRLLKALDLLDAHPRLIHLGSVLEYGAAVAAGTSADPTTVPQPVSSYGRAKLAATKAVLQATETGGLSGMVLRLANLSGPGSPEVSLLGRVAARLLAAGEGRRALVELDPLRACRDYVDVRDVAAAVAAAASVPVTGALVDIGRGESVPVRHLVDLLIECSGVPADVVECPGTGVRHSAEPWMRVDPEPAARILGWRAQRPLAESVSAFWREYRQRHAR